MSVNVVHTQYDPKGRMMANSYEVRPFLSLTRQLEMIRQELPKGASVSHVITLLHIFDVCGPSGITAKDIQMLTGDTTATISRMLKTFNEEYNFIDYQQFGLIGPKLILLSAKGEALKQRVFSAKDDVHKVAQLQQSIIDENKRSGMERRAALERKDVQVQLNAQDLGMKAEVGKVTLKLNTPDEKRFEKAHREAVAEAITYHTGDILKSKIWALKAGTNRYVFDQIIRARRKAVQQGANGFDWRHNMMEIYDPQYGYEQRDELHRELVYGVWFYYNKGEAPDQHLPVAVQRDFDADEFEAFVEGLITDLTDYFIVEMGDITFSGIMKDTREMLNTTQFNKARDRATRAVATIATPWEEAKAQSDARVEARELQVGTLKSLSHDPRVSHHEQVDFSRTAMAAQSKLSAERSQNEIITKQLEATQEQLATLAEEIRKIKEGK